MYEKIIKPAFDLCFSLLILLILSPFLLAISIILFIQNKDSPFFLQSRIGFNNREFKILKFKTMRDVYDSSQNLLPDFERITSFGAWLRRNSLDEVPQLINMLLGNMSLIGPRPLLPEYLPLYNTSQLKRHQVKPGITGWAQVNGRNAISWNEKFKLDIWYLEHISFKTDWKIFLLTLGKVLGRKDINASLEAPMEKFKGNNL
jgi:undecaprenyl phosphate N,N'-diacetylbacillosamine 1-phosphate transferase